MDEHQLKMEERELDLGEGKKPPGLVLQIEISIEPKLHFNLVIWRKFKHSLVLENICSKNLSYYLLIFSSFWEFEIDSLALNVLLLITCSFATELSICCLSVQILCASCRRSIPGTSPAAHWWSSPCVWDVPSPGYIPSQGTYVQCWWLLCVLDAEMLAWFIPIP